MVAVERENLRLNRVPGRACQLDWRDRDAAAQLGAFDLILCADLLYASTRVKASSGMLDCFAVSTVTLLCHLLLGSCTSGAA